MKENLIQLATYSADVGTCVINGIGINNGLGDGTYGVFYAKEKTRALEKNILQDVWIDLRNNYPVIIHGYDCDHKGDERFGQTVLNKANFPGAEALQIAVDDGDIIFVKYF